MKFHSVFTAIWSQIAIIPEVLLIYGVFVRKVLVLTMNTIYPLSNQKIIVKRNKL